MENFNPSYKIYFTAYESEVYLNIKINYLQSNANNKGKYDLSYDWQIISGNSNIHQNQANPFLNMAYNYDTTDLEGLIIVDNKLSTEMIKHLVMPENELSKICGNGTAMDYKKRILNSLSLFWS